MLTLKTNMGDIVLELDFENTSKTAENFMAYAKAGFYNGTIFHRVINNFMIQGGGFLPNMEQKATKPTIENEADKGQKNTLGTIAMARTSDPHSATAQFFINVAQNDFLNFRAKNEANWGYCVFGKVVEGMDVVNKMKEAKTTTRQGHQDVPVENIIIEEVVIHETEKE
jgi:peptidyl-prolyl cis-trans isomerase B (cyclophilin B)